MQKTSGSFLAPIYVVSKRNPKGSTMELLKEAQIPFTVVIEPNDEELYERHQFNLCVLPKSNMGSTYIYDYLMDNILEPFWMLDDNLDSFFMRVTQTNRPGIAPKIQKISIDKFLTDGQRRINRIAQHVSDLPIVGFKNTISGMPKSEHSWNEEYMEHILYMNPTILRPLNTSFMSNIIFIELRAKQIRYLRINDLIYVAIKTTNHQNLSNNRDVKFATIHLKAIGKTRSGATRHRVTYVKRSEFDNDMMPSMATVMSYFSSEQDMDNFIEYQ